ncbi:GlxA family transcriptional regulator [Undibacterium rugosum]|nr:helix-turn-helix domain-containing protein [Undibacterium rugosum]
MNSLHLQSDPIAIYRYNQAMTTSPYSPAPVRVAVLAFDGISPFHLSVPSLVFGESVQTREAAAFEVRVCAAETQRGGRKLRSSAGFYIEPRYGYRTLREADIVIIPSWHQDLRAAPPELLTQLRKAHAAGAMLVGLCLGAFVLAQCGLLQGRTATTHWAAAREFALRFPDVCLAPDVLYVAHPDVMTSAGTAAAIDCCLHILRTQCGPEAAAQVARKLVVAPHRQGGQAQYIERPLPESASDQRLTQLMDWMLAHLCETPSVDDLAARACMSRRSFTRHFQQQTGSSPGKWLLHQRLNHAQRALESSELSIEQIALQSGFGSALMMRRYFARELQISPSTYRQQFRTNVTV